MKSFVLLISFSVLVLITNLVLIASYSIDPDTGISFGDLVRSHGFEVDTHLVTTEDGYILTLHRVINPTMAHRLSKLKPVILNAGIGETGIDFMLSSPFLYSNVKYNKEESNLNHNNINTAQHGFFTEDNNEIGDNLGFDLALTERYDVWVANKRGIMRTLYQHVNLPTSDSKFWAYSWDEMGRYDLPAIIDYILAKTGRTTLSYVGFSEGTTSLYVLLTMKPEYAEKIEPAISLAPSSFMTHSRSPVRFLNFRLLGRCRKDGQFFMNTKINNVLGGYLCPLDLTKRVCGNMLFLATGFDNANFNTTRVPVYLSHLPAPISNREICHYYQLYRTKRFSRYDFGSGRVNWAHYGQSTPPDYPLERVGNVTMAFFLGKNDYYSALSDVANLQIQLGKSKATLLPNYIIDVPHWSHLSFMFGIGAGRLVYKDLIQVLDRYMLDH